VNVPIQYSGSNLIVNSPSVNTDVTLLNIRKAILVHLNELNGNLVAEPDHSHLLLSGIIEGQASYLDDSGGPNRSDIDVTNVTLDSFILGPSDWLLGLVELTYDNGGGSFREADSRVLVNKAFVTFGNFKVSPWYGTFGQFYVPFGTYSSVMISDTLPKLLTRTKARSVLVGFQQKENNAFYGAAYIFSGDAHVGASPRVINNGGLNAGYRFVTGDEFFSGNVGGGVIGDISDSGGMQAGNGFGNSAAAERIKHHVPGYNARGLFSIGGKVDVIMEWVGASTAYSPLDMTYNDQGAKPWALDTQIAYSFYMFENKPFSAGLGYAMTHQALSLGLPKKRYSVVLNSSMWRNTLQSIEFRHDVGYSRGSTATGALGEPVGTTIPPRGGMDNAVTVLFDYYF
jgi:hypothetical protein